MTRSIPTTVAEAAMPVPPHRKVGLFLEIVCNYTLVRWLLWRRDFRGTLARLRRPLRDGQGEVPDPDLAYVIGARLGRAVVQAFRILPTDTRCLNRSLVLTALLARRGIDCTVVIGVATGTDFRAHAWVERDGREMLGSGEQEYERLTGL